MEIELGVGLIRLADPNRGGDLLERVQRVRQNVAAEIGIILPKVRIRDNMRLDAEPVSHQDRRHAGGRRAKSSPTQLLAIDSGMTTGQIDGIADARTRRSAPPPCGSIPAARDQAEMYGYTVVEPGAVLATHLTEVCRRHADEILTRDATKHLIDELKTTSPAVVDELIPGVMTLAEVQQILQMLLREQVSIRQLGADPGNARRSCAAVEGPDPADRVRAASAGPADLHALSQRRGRAVRRHARSGAGRPHSRRLRAHRARAVHPHVAAGGRGDLPGDRRARSKS